MDTSLRQRYTWDGMLHKMTDKQWNAMLAVHNTAPFRIVRAASPYMRDAGKKEMDEGKTPEHRCIINVRLFLCTDQEHRFPRLLGCTEM